jgi:hypothetical protein
MSNEQIAVWPHPCSPEEIERTGVDVRQPDGVPIEAQESAFGPVAKWGRVAVHGRDELEALIRANATPYREDTWFTEPDSDLPKILAGIILADGWRKP